MKTANVDDLVKNKINWLDAKGPDSDVAISSRIRYARNLASAPFPINAKDDELDQVQQMVRVALEQSKALPSPLEFKMGEMNELDRFVLLERRLISQEFTAGQTHSSLIVDENEVLAVMINEEDHLRLQVMRSGFQLMNVLDTINDLDDALAQGLPYAFDNDLGYLTSCPTNVGTGMRASVMLHLPGLVLGDQINAVIQGVNKLGLAVRGIFGEGSDNLGNLFQVSNQSTLGESEKQIIERLQTVIQQIINHEKNARIRLLEKRQNFLLNHVGRAYGILKHSYIISSEETLHSLSALRMGVEMGMFSSIDINTINDLFATVQPAHLQKYTGKKIESEERDVLRAAIIKEKLRHGEDS